MKALACALVLALTCTGAVGAHERVTLDVRDTEIADVLRLLAANAGRNLVVDGSVRPARVTLRLNGVGYDEALAMLSRAYGLQTHREGTATIVGDAVVMNRRYGTGGAGDGDTAVITLARGRADEVALALTAALPAGTVVVGDKRSGTVVVTADAATVRRARSLAATLDAPVFGQGGIGSEAIPLRFARASDVVKSLKGALPENTAFANDVRNAVLLSGNAEARSQASTLIRQLDVPGRQVMFDIRVADIEPTNEQTNVGVQFGGRGFGTGALGQIAYTLTQSSVVVNAQLNALVQQGHASILAQPRLAAFNNQEAALLVGETYPVVVVNVQTGFPTVQPIDIGVKLKITPTIGADGTVTADVHPEYSQIVGFNNQYPIVANRRVDSRLRVADGETIVLGGLLQDVDSETVTKLPWLGDVPLFGGLFRNRQRTRTRDEVVFFITPHIL